MYSFKTSDIWSGMDPNWPLDNDEKSCFTRFLLGVPERAQYLLIFESEKEWMMTHSLERGLSM